MRKKPQAAVCGADVLSAIRNAYPDNMVTDDVLYEEDSYYDEIRDEVRAALRSIKGADILYDRPPEGRPHWNEGSDREEDPPDWIEEASSYDLVFLALRGEQFEFKGELEEEEMPEDGDEPVLVTAPTVGRIGCAVGISIIAPFAVIRFTDMELTDCGSGTIPDIWSCTFDVDGDELNAEENFDGLFSEEGVIALRTLRENIARILRVFGIWALSEQELTARIPGLRPEPTRNVMSKRRTATVENALFFQTF